MLELWTVSYHDLYLEQILTVAAIGRRDSSMQVAQVLAQLGGGFFANTLPPPEDIPATVTGKMSKQYLLF